MQLGLICWGCGGVASVELWKKKGFSFELYDCYLRGMLFWILSETACHRVTIYAHRGCKLIPMQCSLYEWCPLELCVPSWCNCLQWP